MTQKYAMQTAKKSLGIINNVDVFVGALNVRYVNEGILTTPV